MLRNHSFTLTNLKILAVSFTAILFNQGTASAQVASASGSATLTINPSITTTVNGGTTTILSNGGYTSTVSGETVLPQGYFFNGSVTVTPDYTNVANLGFAVTSLTINPGTPSVVAQSSTFNRAAAQILIDAAAGSNTINTNIESVTAIIKAGAGINGLD
jgi:hypothetical protein